MTEFKRYFTRSISLTICAVLAGLLIYYFLGYSLVKEEADHFVQEREGLGRLLKNSSEIQRVWSEGEDTREWGSFRSECLNHYKISDSFDESMLRCNPKILECLDLFAKKKNYRFIKPDSESQKIYRHVTKSNFSNVGMLQSGYLFSIEDNLTKKKLNLLLSDQCQEIYLQNRAYAYGEEILEKGSEDYRFDNFSQNIYIDRHLVTNAELNDWIEFGNPDFVKNIKKREDKDSFLPATNLSLDQMQNYCSYKGRQLLLAHYFDAATFMPMDLADTLPKKNNRSPYYWTKKKSEFKEDCQLIFSEECFLKNKKFQLNSTSPTWTGLMDAMGGPFEAFRNPIDPESNLKASSYYFNFKSAWHRLGFRAKWDGDSFELRNFDFKGINPQVNMDKFQIGFRCMRESK